MRSFHLRRNVPLCFAVVVEKNCLNSASAVSIASTKSCVEKSAHWARVRPVEGSRTGNVLLEDACLHFPAINPRLSKRDGVSNATGSDEVSIVVIEIFHHTVSTNRPENEFVIALDMRLIWIIR